MTAAPSRRNRLIRRVHAAARSAGLDEDTRRDAMERATGKRSCTGMTEAELALAADAIDAAGRGAAARDRLPNEATSGKLRALWISAWHLGVARDRTDAALAAWIRGRFGVDAAAWLHGPGAVKAVEGLKAWLEREASVDWSPYAAVVGGRTREIDNPRARVLEAQWRILHGLGRVVVASPDALAAYARRHAGIGRRICHTQLAAPQADALIRHLGKRIREAKAEAGEPR